MYQVGGFKLVGYIIMINGANIFKKCTNFVTGITIISSANALFSVSPNSTSSHYHDCHHLELMFKRFEIKLLCDWQIWTNVS